jgi:hypothetical protein
VDVGVTATCWLSFRIVMPNPSLDRLIQDLWYG